MLGIELTETQNHIWMETGQRLAAGIPIRHLALQYYVQYREHLIQQKMFTNSEPRVNSLMQIAYFISQKNQVVYNLRGERVMGVALSINEIIKKNNDFEDFIFHMKEMLKVIIIDEKEVEKEIDGCLKKFKFTLTFYQKFRNTLKKIHPLPSDLTLLQSLLWLIFILCKQKLKTQCDLINCTCLLALTFIYYIQESQALKNGECELKDKNYGGVLSQENAQHVLLQYFRLKDMNKYCEMQRYFSVQIQELKAKIGCDYLLAEGNMEQIYRRVDSFYQKLLYGDNIDERHFLKERINTVVNANRFTPFGGRKIHHQTTRGALIPNRILSHRVLNYETQNKPLDPQEEMSALEQNAENTGSVLMKNLMTNRTPGRTPLIKATPVTNAMEMRNWVLEKCNYHKFNIKELPQFLVQDQYNLKLINGLWKDVCLYESQKEQIGKQNSLSFLALATQIVYLVIDREGSFENIVSQFSLSWLALWSKIDTFLKYDSRMPTSIKVHLLSLETTIISKRLWEQGECTSIFSENKQKLNDSTFERLFKRVIHEIVYQVFFISRKLDVNQSSMNAIFLLCQYAIGDYNQLLSHRNIYQLIMCSFFAISKALQLNINFHTIMKTFQQINKLPKQDYQELTQQIYIDQQTISDIINFYNGMFIKKIKPFLVHLKYNTPQIADIAKHKRLINSSVKELLSENLVAMSENNKSSQPQTPFSQALMAYNESPLLKEKKIKNLANCIDGKRLLDKRQVQTKNEAIKQVSTLITKKWKNCKSPESKLLNTLKKEQK